MNRNTTPYPWEQSLERSYHSVQEHRCDYGHPKPCGAPGTFVFEVSQYFPVETYACREHVHEMKNGKPPRVAHEAEGNQ